MSSPSSPNVPPPAPVAYVGQYQVNASGMGVFPGTSPNAVVAFQNSACLFFTGNGSNGIWLTTTTDGVTWTQVAQIKANNPFLGINTKTSPAAVVVQVPATRLFLFYTGNGNNGIFFSTTIDLQTWTNVTQLLPTGQQFANIQVNTNPCPLIFDDIIHLYYSDIQSGGLYTLLATSETPGQKDWGLAKQMQSGPTSGPQAMNILAGTSPSAVVYDDTIYVFFTVGGGASSTMAPTSQTSAGTANGNSIWYTTSLDGLDWNSPLPIPGATNVPLGNSPTAFVSGSALYLFWFSSGGLQAVVTLDGATWVPNPSFASQISAQQTFSAQTNAATVVINNQLNVLWTGPSNSISTIYGSQVAPLASLVNSSIIPILSSLSNQSAGLSLSVDDPKSAQILQEAVTLSQNPVAIVPEIFDGKYFGLFTGVEDVVIPSGVLTASITPEIAKWMAIQLASAAAEYVVYAYISQVGTIFLRIVQGVADPNSIVEGQSSGERR